MIDPFNAANVSRSLVEVIISQHTCELIQVSEQLVWRVRFSSSTINNSERFSNIQLSRTYQQLRSSPWKQIGEKPYKCKLCSYSACRKDMITRHLKVHNKNPNEFGHSWAGPNQPLSIAEHISIRNTFHKNFWQYHINLKNLTKDKLNKSVMTQWLVKINLVARVKCTHYTLTTTNQWDFRKMYSLNQAHLLT